MSYITFCRKVFVVRTFSGLVPVGDLCSVLSLVFLTNTFELISNGTYVAWSTDTEVWITFLSKDTAFQYRLVNWNGQFLKNIIWLCSLVSVHFALEVVIAGDSINMDYPAFDLPLHIVNPSFVAAFVMPFCRLNAVFTLFSHWSHAS